MKQKLIPLVPYLLVLALTFYLLPLLAFNLLAAVLLLFLAMPLAAFLDGLILGLRRGFFPLLSLAAFLLFLPTVPLFYYETAWVYGTAYAAAVFAGNGIGALISRKRRRSDTEK